MEAGASEAQEAKISPCMQDKEAILNRIQYFKDELQRKLTERQVEFDTNGVSPKYKSLSNRMSSLKNDIKKWERRLAAL